MIALYKSGFSEKDRPLVENFVKAFRGQPYVIFFNEYFGINIDVPRMSSNNLWDYNYGDLIVVGDDCVKLAKQCPVWKHSYVYDGNFETIKEEIDAKSKSNSN